LDGESYTIDNPNIPQREIGICKFNKIAESIINSADVRDEDLQNVLIY